MAKRVGVVSDVMWELYQAVEVKRELSQKKTIRLIHDLLKGLHLLA